MATTDQGPVEVTQPGEVRVRRALLTVSDKRGLVEFARGLADLDIEIVSTGGTARELEGAGIGVRPIDDYTGFPEILDGRVKTLNPRIYAGLLAVRSNPEHLSTLGDHGIEPIDLVCVNLYPFERTAALRGVRGEHAARGVPARARVRPDERLRWCLRLQPPGRGRRRAGAPRDLRRARVRAGLHARGARHPDPEAERPDP